MFDIIRKPDRVQLICGTYKNETKVWLEDQNDVSVAFTETDEGLKIDITGDKTPLMFVKCRWYGKFERGSLFFGDAIERAYGSLKFEGVRPERIMPWYSVCKSGNHFGGYGVKVRPDAFIFWQTDPSGITLTVDVRCGSNGYAMAGKTIHAATVVTMFGEYEQAADFLSDFCKKMADAPVLPDKPVYGFNNWYYAYGNITQESVLADAKLLAELTEGLDNRPFMVIDDGWQDRATVSCTINHKFTDMKALADDMKALAVRPGIWIRPLLPKAEEYTELRSTTFTQFLDPSLDETLAVIAADMQTITKDWGYELVKYDFSTCDTFGRFHPVPTTKMTDFEFTLRNPMTNAQAIKGLYKTILDNSNGAIIIGCNCVSHLGAGYFHLHRSGDDTSGNDWERTRYMGVNTLAFRLCQHKAFFEADADCIGNTGKTDFTWEMASRWLELLVDSSTPLFVSIAPEIVTGTIKEQLKAAFKTASKQEGSFKPLDLEYSTMPTRYEVNGIIKEYDLDDVMGAEYMEAHV